MMKIWKRALALLLALALLGSVAVLAADEEAAAEEEVAEETEQTPEEEKEPADSSEEVIYGVLDNNGEVQAVYAVVILESLKEGERSYHGPFGSVKNLSDTREILLEDDMVTLTAPEGRFYFQSDLSSLELPWIIDITYTLDGEEIDAAELGGKSGKLGIHISTGANERVDSAFYDAYLLQISVTLDTELCSNVEAPNATAANSGSSKVLNYTVLPGKDADISLSADVKDFTMAGITVAGMPYSMDGMMDDAMGDMDGFTDGLTQLSDAVSQLSDGAASLTYGAYKLKNGAAEFGSGLTALSGGSAELVNGSAQIQAALQQIADLINDSGVDMDLGQLMDLLDTLGCMMESLGGQLSSFAGSIDGTITSVGSSLGSIGGVDQGSLDELLAANPDNVALQQLIAYYRAALEAQGSWSAGSEELRNAAAQLAAIGEEMSAQGAALREQAAAMREMLEAMGGENVQLTSAVNLMAEQYARFHEGLVQYTGGVDALAANWPALYKGMEQLCGGAWQLSDGTSQLNEGTQGIPEEMDKLLSDFSNGDFEARSFLDEENGACSAVQFVLTTQGIELPEEDAAEPLNAGEEAFFAALWGRLKALFEKQ